MQLMNEKVQPDNQLIDLIITARKTGHLGTAYTLIELRYRTVARFIRLPAATAC